ncbi:hypothetical protein JAAARDRAFT_190313 [Jaapia argillacea MUCL 33604]|uniref:Uncharacterized protein n=1 Tax=Jaapia argillacea MUCL 33604 TaxID=933084 RepID=A0A067QDK1_9AGAM|nr:hypothetical protein JAAARDRAFT_190313 [Jaapia argillacea MUCL 33604]
MDDIWGNAWGESTKPPPATTTHEDPVWPARSPILTGDNEADIGLPSWSTGSDIRWNEPSETAGSLWSQPDNASAWGATPSPYEDISLGRIPTPEIQPPLKPPSRQEELPFDVPLPPVRDELSLPSPFVEEDEAQEVSIPVAESSLSTPRPPSPDGDGFGTFESGVDAFESTGLEPWSPSGATFAAEDVGSGWASAWSTSQHEATPDTDSEKLDEWERAKRQKEQGDMKVPPEVISSLVHQCEEFVNDVWPAPERTSADDDDWRNSWRTHEESAEGLDAAIDTLPEIAKLPINFRKTSTAKSMAEAVKLTRNAPITRLSPMSRFLEAKGSTTWEAEVKLRPIVIQDDIPMGWKVLEKDPVASTPSPIGPDKGKKPSGGLLSFMTRRASTQPNVDVKSSRPNTPVSDTPRSSSAAGTTASPRHSGESRRSRTTSVSTPSSVVPSPIASKPATNPFTEPSPTTVTPATEVAASMSSYSSAPDPVTVGTTASTPPPSAVSRFFNRFSRAKSSPGTGRTSIALSSNDLEFLSDIPSASDGEGHDDPQLTALSQMFGSQPVPLPEKLPPPLAPPPKLSQPVSRPLSVVNERELPPVLGQPKPVPSLSVTGFPGSSGRSIQPRTESPLPLPPTSSSAIRNPTRPSTSTSSADWSLSTDLNPFSSTTPSRIRSPPVLQPPPKTSSPFSLPPPPSSRPHTPKLPPPPRSRTPSSSYTFPPPLSPPVSSRTPTPTLSPPPHIASRSTMSTPPLAPPPSQFKPSNTFMPPTPTPKDLFEDDDFSDFHSSFSQPSFSNPPSTSLYDSSSASDSQLFGTPKKLPPNKHGTKPSFDDFDDFISSTIPSPSPPQPPAKPTPLPIGLPSPSPAPSQTRPKVPKTRKPSAADHLATLHLLEAAAARPGRWPAPPSPLPEALPPPPHGGAGAPFDTNTFERGFAKQQTLRPPPSVSSPPLTSHSISLNSNSLLQPISPPSRAMPNSQPLQGFSAFGSSQSDIMSPPRTNVSKPPPSRPSASSTTKGGLSAQDISFFEGL